ncbi:MAG: amidohydrolase family protein [Clostridia bacterium]|nr:amidohydrolase family protein [Clostridia bacterium]MBO5416039.1 amidohydrolase family protein [Clostridia bacterium]
MIFNGEIKEVIDGHLHIDGCYEDDGADFLNGFDEYIEKGPFRAVCIAALPSGKKGAANRDPSNNIMAAFCKIANPKVYAFGGLTYRNYPQDPDALGDMALDVQYKELMDIGFDGIKMLEGKPNLYRYVGNRLDSDMFDGFFAEAEKNGTHILMHACDPIEFWTEEYATPEYIAKGWSYVSDEYPKKEEIYAQVENILKKHPRLSLTLAHFYFMADDLCRLGALFDKYENLGVDITPGGEMYVSFEKNRDKTRDFFNKYSDRIMLGTDGSFPKCMRAMEWLADRTYRYITTNDTFMGFEDKYQTGLLLERDAQEKILSKNFIRRVSDSPKPINKAALKKYIEKYKHLIRDEKALALVEKYSEQLLK